MLFQQDFYGDVFGAEEEIFFFRYRLVFPYFALRFLRLPQMSQNEPWWEVTTSLAAIISEGSKLKNSRSSEYQLVSECAFSPDCFTSRAKIISSS